MKCPRCKARLKVTNTWNESDRLVKRRRLCPDCGYQQITFEELTLTAEENWQCCFTPEEQRRVRSASNTHRHSPIPARR